MITFSQLGRYGRFANSLFQVAGVIGIATRLGYAYGFPRWMNHDHKDRFGSTEDIDLQKYFVNPLPTIDNSHEYQDFPISWGWHGDIHVPDNVSLSGHMQSEKYFKHCIKTVRHYFKMKGENEPQDVCAVHVRLGDYDDAYHPRLKSDYYTRAIEQFQKGTKFLIFSDDLSGASGMFIRISEDLGIDFALSTRRDYIEDFRAMKQCKHFIIGNSSYSLMAAILADHPEKKIVCPENWFGPAWGQYHKLMAKDIYPENSILI